MAVVLWQQWQWQCGNVSTARSNLMQSRQYYYYMQWVPNDRRPPIACVVRASRAQARPVQYISLEQSGPELGLSVKSRRSDRGPDSWIKKQSRVHNNIFYAHAHATRFFFKYQPHFLAPAPEKHR